MAGITAQSQKKITEIIVGVIIGLFSLISAINIFNIIYSNIILRRKNLEHLGE